MTQDFAKQHRTAPAPEKPSPGKGAWFFAGFICGVFLTSLAALWYFVPTKTVEPSQDEEVPVAEPQTQAEEMQWDFYEISPRSVVPVVAEYADTGEKVEVDNFAWILQTGSFLRSDDADEMRASLILMGFDVTISTVEVSGHKRHRVILGPFETELERNRAQDKLAQAQIESLAIKIPR